MQVEKKLYLTAEPHEAVYTQGQCYAEKDGFCLFESIMHEAKNSTGIGMGYYAKQIIDRYSPDNGKTWKEKHTFDAPENIFGKHEYSSCYFLDKTNNVLIRFYTAIIFDPENSNIEMFSDAGANSRTRYAEYQVSLDNGKTWLEEKQIICEGHEYDKTHWGPVWNMAKTAVCLEVLLHCKLKMELYWYRLQSYFLTEINIKALY